MPRDLTDKTIVITGGSSGIGAATALACAEAGMDVVIAARRVEALEQVAEQVRQRGRRAWAIPCDVAQDEPVRSLFERVMADPGRIDAVFANAGYGLHGSVEELTEAQHRRLFEVNYWGTMRTIHAGLPALRATPGGLRHLLICSSSGSEIAIPYMGAYTATKAAQDLIGGALRAELHHEGVKVTTVHPVGTHTEFIQTMQDVSTSQTPMPNIDNTPRGFSQTPEVVAKRVVACLRRPKAEVWPQPAARYALALLTASPWLAERALRKLAKKMRE